LRNRVQKSKGSGALEAPNGTNAGSGKLHFLLSVLTVFFLASVGIVDAAETTLSLAQAIDRALQDNSELRAARNSLLAQKEDIGIARGSLFPHVSLEQRFTRTDNPPGVFMAKLNQQRFSPSDFDVTALNNPKPVTDLQTMVAIDQAVFAAGAFVGLEMAKKEHAAQREDYGRRSEETILKVAETYLQILTAKEYVRVARTALEDAGEHTRIAESRHRNAVGLYADVLRTKTAVTEAEQRVVTSEKNLSIAKRALGMFLGMDGPVDAAGDGLEAKLRELGHYRGEALSRRDVKAMQIRQQNAKNGVRMAESRYLPTVGLRASYQWNDHRRIIGPEGESWWLAGVLKWDFFDGGARESERSKAIYRKAETDERLKGLVRYVAFKVEEAYLSAEEAAKNLDLSRLAMATAEEGRRLVKSRYENSLSPMIDLLDVQMNVDHARANLVAKENEYRVAVIRVGFESGTIWDDLLIDSGIMEQDK
jgi:outer membrane protein